jgi:hypothetical protein
MEISAEEAGLVVLPLQLVFERNLGLRAVAFPEALLLVLAVLKVRIFHIKWQHR